MSETKQLVQGSSDVPANVGGSETTPIQIRRTSYADNYPRPILDDLILRRPPCISMNTVCQIINALSILSLNVMVVLFYDENSFRRADVFWGIFGFSCIALMTRYRNYIVSMISEVAMTAFYLWCCDWNRTLLIPFCSLLFLMFCCKLVPRLVMRFCSNSTLYIIHQNILKIQKNRRKEGCGLDLNGDGIFIAFTTVPMFYFNQDRVWGEEWFAMVVVFVFIYHRLMYLRLLVLRDSYIQKTMDQMVGETEQMTYGQSTDTDLFKQRLTKCLSNDEDLQSTFSGVDSLFIDTIIVPLFYDGMVAGLIIWDLVRLDIKCEGST